MRLAFALLTASAAFGANCVPVSALRPSGAVKGILTENNCRLSDGATFAEYVLFLPTHGEVDLTAAPASLILRDSSGVKIADGERILRRIERGEYSVLVTGAGGEFELRTAFIPEPNTICRTPSLIGRRQTVTARLTSNSCRLPDRTAFDDWQVTIYGSGTLEITLEAADFATHLILRDREGHALATGAKIISLPVPGDQDYVIVAAAAEEGKIGEYKLAVNFTPADDETCRPQPGVETSAELKGTLSTGDCPLGQQFRFQYFDVPIPAAGLADFRITASDFAPQLALFDASGRLVSFDLESGGARRPILQQQLDPGSYTLLVIGAQPGAYTLQYQFRPGLPGICPALSIEAGRTVTGSLAGASSCRSRDSMEDVYRFTLNSAGTIDLAMASQDFDSILVLRDAKDNVLVTSFGDVNFGPEISASLPAGAYSVSARGQRAGGYALGYAFAAGNLPPCSRRQPINVNTGFIGILTGESCRDNAGQPVDYYEFTTPEDGTVLAVLTSAALDPFLTLEDTEGNVLRRDDNSYGAGSLISQFLPAKTYRLSARSAIGGEIGRYQVNLFFTRGERPPGCLPLRSASRGETIAGALAITSCQYFDETFADYYRLEAPEAATVDATLTARSTQTGPAFDAFLELLDNKGNLIESNDNSGGGFNARIIREMAPGTYYIVAKSQGSRGYALGEYTMALK
ncbi:MAG: PPC domain-containing protein [Bryobacteraceae bacterium]